MRAVDTNVLVRLLAQDDTVQVVAARRWVEEGVWVSTLALAEALWVLSFTYDRGPAEIAAAVETLLKHRNLTLQDSDVVAAALARFRERPSVGFSDCLLLELARKAGHLPLGTFDRNLSKLNGARKI
jgi:predicted nucleic-acid-binding protein